MKFVTFEMGFSIIYIYIYGFLLVWAKYGFINAEGFHLTMVWCLLLAFSKRML